MVDELLTTKFFGGSSTKEMREGSTREATSSSVGCDSSSIPEDQIENNKDDNSNDKQEEGKEEEKAEKEKEKDYSAHSKKEIKEQQTVKVPVF